MRALLLILAALSAVPPAGACTVAPASYYRSLSKLVAEANWIALARFESREVLPLPEICDDEPMREMRPRPQSAKGLISRVRTFRDNCFFRERDRFVPVEALVGTTGAEITMVLPEERTSRETTHDDHEGWLALLRPNDWSVKLPPPRWGRVGISSDCGLYPDFEKGAMYLLFGASPHGLGFERIDSPETDVWLAAVRNEIEAQERARRITSP